MSAGTTSTGCSRITSRAFSGVIRLDDLSAVQPEHAGYGSGAFIVVVDDEKTHVYE
jgi:hypothetical protein